MDPITLALIMGGTAMASQVMSNKQTEKANEANAKMAAAKTKYSPFTGMGAGSYQRELGGSVIGSGMQGAIAGASLGSTMSPNAGQGENKMMTMNTATSPSGQSVNPYEDYVKRSGFGNRTGIA